MKNRVQSFSTIRSVSCFAICILHTFYAASVTFTDAASKSAMISMTIRNLMYFAVPSFVMVTGALLLSPEKKISYRRLFTRYMGRIAGALLLFTLIYECYSSWMNTGGLHFESLQTGFIKFLTNGSWSHMWYLYLLMALYFLLPIYKRAASAMAPTDFRYLLCVYLFFLSILPGLEGILGKTGWYICVQTIYPFYFFLGYAISQGIVRIPRGGAVPIFLGGSILMATLTIVSYHTGNEGLRQYAANYSSLPTAILAVGFFGMLTAGSRASEGLWVKVINRVDSCSFGIYLVHMIFVNLLLLQFRVNPYRYGGCVGPALAAVLIFLLSWGTTEILHKIPGVKKLV